jgi:hypothetical protein
MMRVAIREGCTGVGTADDGAYHTDDGHRHGHPYDDDHDVARHQADDDQGSHPLIGRRNIQI